MKYVSLDIETTGLDPRQHQGIEIALVQHWRTFVERKRGDVPADGFASESSV